MRIIGFGGGCHWCTEAVFQSLKGVEKVEQGWISPTNDISAFSESVLVHFEPKQISIDVLVAIHLHTHSSTSEHEMRDKYRSAIYIFSQDQEVEVNKAIDELQNYFEQPVITAVLPFGNFKINDEQFFDYYYKAPQRPFCQTYIQPKLKFLLDKFETVINQEKIAQHLSD